MEARSVHRGGFGRWTELSAQRKNDIRPQNLQPRLDVLRVISVRFRAQPQVRANERRPEFRNQFFGGVR